MSVTNLYSRLKPLKANRHIWQEWIDESIIFKPPKYYCWKSEKDSNNNWCFRMYFSFQLVQIIYRTWLEKQFIQISVTHATLSISRQNNYCITPVSLASKLSELQCQLFIDRLDIRWWILDRNCLDPQHASVFQFGKRVGTNGIIATIEADDTKQACMAYIIHQV